MVNRLESTKKCFLCDSEVKSELKAIPDIRFGVKGDWTIERCSGCGATQTFPLPSLDELRYFYGKYYNNDAKISKNYTREIIFKEQL